MEWMKAELILSWIAVAFYCFSTVGFAWWLFFERRRVHTVSLALGIAGFVSHSAALGLRWVMTGHGPYTTTYEVYSSNGWVIMALLFVVAWRIPRLSATAVVAIPLNILFLMLALAKYQKIPGLSTAFNYFWLLVHILFVKLAIAGIIIALGCSVFYLRKARTEEEGELSNLELYNYRFTGLGFVFWTIATASGAVWANLQWGRYWAWDPIETWSLVVWLGLGLNLHLQRFFNWTGRRAAYLTLATVGLFILTLFVVPFLSSSLHSMYVVGAGDK